MKFILGSSSPRRLELLSILGIKPDEIIAPNIDETINKKELPLDYCKRIATQKMKYFDGKHKNNVILTADTIAYSGRKIIDKTNDEVIARKNLNKLSGPKEKLIGFELGALPPCPNPSSFSFGAHYLSRSGFLRLWRKF